MHSLKPDLACGVFEAAPDAMIIVDDLGVVRFANQRVSALFGFPQDEIVGRSVEQLIPERFRDGHRHHRTQYLDNVRVRPMGQGLELLGRRRDGTEFPVEVSLSPIRTDQPVLLAAAIRDMSDRKRVEQDLVAARSEAERVREIADRANQAKSRFLATASHDLRQPLQALALLNGMLHRKVVDADCRQALAQQEQAIGAMSRLVNALLDISKLESGAIKPDPTDFAVAALFDELRREFAELAADKGLQLEVGKATDCVHSDRSLVGQVLRNLISNAIKYTRQGRVSLRCLHARGPLVRIEVLDTGIGIPLAQIPYICDEFYQVDVPSTRSRDGYGLGLSIVRRIVALLDLKLEVRSEVDRGSSFALELPAAAGAVASQQRSSIVSAAHEPRPGDARLLLVEDDAAVRTAAQKLLEIEGYRVTAAASRAEALRAADLGRQIDLVVTDYHLGSGHTGMDVIAALRERLGEPLPAVLLTGDTSSAVKALSADPDLRIANKPIDADELFTLIDQLLASRLAYSGKSCATDGLQGDLSLADQQAHVPGAMAMEARGD